MQQPPQDSPIHPSRRRRPLGPTERLDVLVQDHDDDDVKVMVVIGYVQLPVG